jgi:hypothetical protein
MSAVTAVTVPAGATVTALRCSSCRFGSHDVRMLRDVYGGECPDHGRTLVPVAFVPRRGNGRTRAGR